MHRSKLTQTCRNSRFFSDIYAQDYSGYFKGIKDYIYLIGEKHRPQNISPINIFSVVDLENELLALLGWHYYIFLVFLFSQLKGIYNTCAVHTN